ncbi:hypothetical protein Bbelb_124470 [Branchiostoma belcheri]|nr:hypothetical protein Bbelb_124470 [Branchiostoma belcheri]
MDDNNTIRPIGKSEGEHATGTAAKSTFPVTVSRNIIGLVANKMYVPVCDVHDEQAGHTEQQTIPTRHEETEIADAVLDDCDDDPNNDHVYNNRDDFNSLQHDDPDNHVYNNRDDFYNLQQTSEDNGYGEQPADTEEDTTETSNDQRGAERDDNSTPRSIGDPKNIACEHATGTAAESTFPVTVSRNIIGLVGNTMYAPACDQQAGHSEQQTIPTRHEETEIADAVLDDCDDDPDNHIYNNRDDFNSLQQASEDNGYGDQPADKEEDTTETINDQKDASGMLKNPMYIPDSTCYTFLRSHLRILRGILITVVLTALVASGVVVPVIYFTATSDIYPSHIANMSTTPSALTTALPGMTTKPPMVTTTPSVNTTTLLALTTTLPGVTTKPTMVTTIPSVVTTTALTVTTKMSEALTNPRIATTTQSAIKATPSVVKTKLSVVNTTPLAVTTTLPEKTINPKMVTTTRLIVQTTCTLSVATTTPIALTTTPSVATTTPSVVTTTQSVVTTTMSVVTTTPSVVTTTPTVVTTTPTVVTTTLPEVTTTLPEVTTTLPEVTTTLPERTTTLPEVTTTLPEVTTTLPEVTTTLPEVTTTLPEVTTRPKIVTTTQSVVQTTQSAVTFTAAKRYGCQVGYKLLAGACFRLNFREMNYDDASEACKREGARLAMPKTKELDMALSRLVYKEGENKVYYIGLRDGGAFRLWVRCWTWEDGSPLGNYKSDRVLGVKCSRVPDMCGTFPIRT